MPKIKSRPFKLLLTLAAVFVMTGAKAEGCSYGGGPDEPDAESCQAGYHLETVCEDKATNGDHDCTDPTCKQECVPDDPHGCGPDQHAELICDKEPEGWPASDGDKTEEEGEKDKTEKESQEGEKDKTEKEGEKPALPVCEWVCLPNDVCPAGTVAKTVCGESEKEPGNSGEGNSSEEANGKDPADPEDPNADPPKDPNTDPDKDKTDPTSTCWTECIPQPVCPEGQHEVKVCEPTSDGKEICKVDCAPNEQPVCPEDHHEKKVCEPNSDGGETCKIECEPNEEPICPAGQHEEKICEKNSDNEEICKVVCVLDEPVCPPGQELEKVCWLDENANEICKLMCTGDAL